MMLIESTDARVSIPQNEVDAMVAHLESKLSGVDDIKGAYITPSASWSDHCIHEYMKEHHIHGSERAPKCQLNGIVYSLGPQTKMKALFRSIDIHGTLAVYDIASYGSALDKLALEKPERGVLAIEDYFFQNLHRIKDAISRRFTSTRYNTAPHIFEGYEEEEFNVVEYAKLKGGVHKIASKNGCVYMGIYKVLVDDQYQLKAKLIIRSYDEGSSLAILNKIYNEDPTFEEFRDNPIFEKLRQRAKKNTEVSQGNLAHAIIEEILNWKTQYDSKTTIGDDETQVIKYIQPDATFNYNSIIVTEQGDVLYYDHCFPASDMIKYGYWPYLRGRSEGVSLIIPSGNAAEFIAAATGRKTLFGLPMGCRKLIHRSDYTHEVSHQPGIDEKIAFEMYKDKESLSRGMYLTTWHGQGRVNYKLIKGKYECISATDLISKHYGLPKGTFKEVKMATWSNDFGQEFGEYSHRSMSVSDIIALSDLGDPIGITFDSTFYTTHFSSLVSYANDNGKYFNQVVEQQNLEKRILLLNREIVIQYVTMKK